MKVIDLNPAFYCLFVKMGEGKEKRFLTSELSPNPTRYRLDLFESEEAANRWIKSEQEVLALNERSNMQEIYSRLFAKKIFLKVFVQLMKEKKEIDSITFVDENGTRRVYFREDLEDDFTIFPTSYQKLYPKEPIYIIHRQRELEENIILQKEAYFITYPEIATPLFSVGSKEWAEELISRKPDQGYYIEETTLHDVYMRTKLEAKDPGFFILSREEVPHYLLRRSDLQKIVEGTLNYQ